MNLLFDWKEIPHRGKGLTFDDVLIVPTRSDIRSRRDPSLATSATQKKQIQMPVISANMDTVTESDMAIAMAELGGLGILHRFITIPEQVKQLKAIKTKTNYAAASVGVTTDEQDRARALVDAGADILTIDIAHGHSVQMIEMLSWIKKTFSHVQVIAGNVATPSAVKDLVAAGADSIKVGIGPGSMCTTRIITGCGMPQLTAIALCATECTRLKIPLIADGGLRTSGDVMKALAAGADAVMLGSMLAGTLESPGEIKNGKKLYRGMASRSAQDSWRGGVPEGMAPEGEATTIAVKGRARDVVLELAGGLRSGMSYIGASSIAEIKVNAQFIEMSTSGMRESVAHGLK
jgi:IMP dehydrogenase